MKYNDETILNENKNETIYKSMLLRPKSKIVQITEFI